MGIQGSVMAPGMVSFIIQTIFVANINRLAVDKRGATIVGNIIAIVRIADQKAGLLDGASSVCSSLPKLRQ